MAKSCSTPDCKVRISMSLVAGLQGLPCKMLIVEKARPEAHMYESCSAPDCKYCKRGARKVDVLGCALVGEVGQPSFRMHLAVMVKGVGS